MRVLGGPWSAEAIEQHLRDTVVPIRLASLGPDGFPLVLSLWFLYEDGALWCATQRSARLVQRLRRDARCGFEVAADQAPYRGVRGRAEATLDDARGAELLPRLIRRYLGATDAPLASWLLARAESEIALRLGRLRVSSWDFSKRMAT